MNKEIDINFEIKTIRNLKKDYSKIISHLFSLQVKIPYESDQLKSLIAKLHNSTDFNFLDCCKDALMNGSDVFRIAYLLKQTILDLKEIDIIILTDILELFANKMKGDMSAGSFHSAIEDLSETREKFSLKLEKEILQRKKDDILGYLIASYVGLSKRDINSGFNKITDLINKKSNEMYIANGLRGLGCLRENAINNENEIITILKKMNKSKVASISLNSAFATCSLLPFISALRDEVITLSQSNIPEVQYEISNYLKMSDCHLEDWKKACLLKIIPNTRSVHEGITNNIDYILYKALKTSNNLLFAKKILTSWIKSRTKKEMTTKKMGDIFRLSFKDLFTDKTFISQLVTEWFNSDEINFHKANAHLVDYMGLHGINPIFLDKDYLSKLDIDSSLFVIGKILGYIFVFNYSATYLISFLKNDNDSKELFDVVSQRFIEYIGYDYPEKTIKLLEKIDKNEFSQIANNCISAILKKLLEIEKSLMGLKPIRELQPESDLVCKIHNQYQKIIHKQMENIPKDSIMNHVSKVAIKEGRGFFSYMHGKYSEVTNMTYASESIDLPKNDVLDKIGASRKRINLKLAKRGQK